MSALTEIKSTSGKWAIDVANFDRDLTRIDFNRCTGANLSGDIANLPAGLTYLNYASTSSTLTGDIGDLPAGLTYLSYYRTSSILTGDVANLPSKLTFLACYSTSSVLTGNIAKLPARLTNLDCSNTSSTMTGDIANLPAGLTYLNCSRTSSVLNGDIADLPSGLTYVNCYNTSSTLTAAKGTLGCTGAVKILEFTSLGLNAATVDAILVACATHTNWGRSAVLKIGGTNAAPTATGLAAATTLQAAGCTVTHS